VTERLPERILADKGYDARYLWEAMKARGIDLIAPHPSMVRRRPFHTDAGVGRQRGASPRRSPAVLNWLLGALPSPLPGPLVTCPAVERGVHLVAQLVGLVGGEGADEIAQYHPQQHVLLAGR